MPSKQVTFNKVARHLLKQNKKSYIRTCLGLSCQYRGPNGLKCAAGCLITNKEYHVNMEGSTVASDTRPGECISKKGHDLGLVGHLQTLHDCNRPSKWRRLLRIVAANWQLKLPAELRGNK